MLIYVNLVGRVRSPACACEAGLQCPDELPVGNTDGGDRWHRGRTTYNVVGLYMGTIVTCCAESASVWLWAGLNWWVILKRHRFANVPFLAPRPTSLCSRLDGLRQVGYKLETSDYYHRQFDQQCPILHPVLERLVVCCDVGFT
jgi:hypothetical protein